MTTWKEYHPPIRRAERERNQIMGYRPITMDTAVQAVSNGASNICMVVHLTEDADIRALSLADMFLEEVEEQTPKKAVPAQKPAKKRELVSRIDHGRIVALRTAGWTVKAIAEDIGCSEQTVYNHLQKEGIIDEEADDDAGQAD